MAEFDNKIDNMLIEVLHECKTLSGFMHAIFGFLQRNTDFYYVQKNPSDKLGFPKGFRESLLFDAMNYFDPERALNNLNSSDNDCFVPPAVEEIEIPADASNDQIEITQEIEAQPSNLEDVNACSVALTPCKAMQHMDELVDVFPAFNADEYKNGAVFSNYCWSQTISEIEVYIVLPLNVRSAKQLCISVEASAISVQERAKDCKILAGKLWGKCKQHDVLWTMQDGKLNIHMDKMQEIWWEKFLMEENAIDPKSIEYERDISELPEETQAQIHKIRSNEMHKNNASCAKPVDMPVSEQMQRLRMAWDADDSPFKGTPFDPTMVKLA